MKSQKIQLLILICAALFIVAGWTAQGQKQNAGRAQWEYRVVNIYQDDAAKILNDLGVEGWELVAVKPGDDATAKGLYHFKRPK